MSKKEFVWYVPCMVWFYDKIWLIVFSWRLGWTVSRTDSLAVTLNKEVYFPDLPFPAFLSLLYLITHSLEILRPGNAPTTRTNKISIHLMGQINHIQTISRKHAKLTQTNKQKSKQINKHIMQSSKNKVYNIYIYNLLRTTTLFYTDFF